MFKLLIADDEFLVQVGLRSLIDYASMDISIIGVAPNGEDALEIIRSRHPDIVLLDIKMPKMDGIEVMEHLAGSPDLPVFIILTNYEDFDIARKAIRLGAFDYLMKAEISESVLKSILTKAIDKIKEKQAASSALSTGELVLKDQVYLKLLNNLFPSEDVLKENMEALGIPVRDCYTVVYFRCPQAPSLKEDNPKTISYMCSMISGVFEQYYDCYVTPWNFGSFTAIISLNNEDEPGNLRTCAEQVMKLSRRYMSLDLYAGLGDVVPLSDVPTSFSNAMSISNECTEEEPLISFREASREQQDRLRPGFNLATIDTHLREAVDSFNVTEIHTLFDLICQYYLYREHRLNQGIITLSGLLHFISVSFSGSGEMLYQLFPGSDDPFYALEHIRNMDQIIQYIRNIEEVICTRVEHDFERSKNWIVPNIKQYIKDNYDKPLSLTDVAEAFNISAGYISTLFKKNNDGVGFSECVTQAKIIRAKQLLSETHMKIYEVSDAVGYNDPYYFSKIFKKITGYSPKDYISLNRKEPH